MFTKSFLVVIMAVVCHHNTSGQLSGGVSSLPGGGQTQQIGYQAGPASGSLSQSFDRLGMGTPITYNGGLSATSAQGTGVSGSLAVQPGIGGQGSVVGLVGLLNRATNRINAFAQHDRFLDKDLQPVGPETNSAGLNYLNKDGTRVFAQGSQTNGQPAVGTVGGSIPLYTNENAQISATAQSSFGHGRKPNNQIEIQGTVVF